jgi:hypothetical protein
MPIYKDYNKDFFKKWSDDMAYVLGFLFADGNITLTKRGTHFIALYTKDKALLLSIQSVIKSNHMISVIKSETGSVYRIQIGSREWFDDIQRYGLHPNKATRMELPIIPPKHFGSFVRGYFDGDGNVWQGYINKKRKTPTKVLYVAFTSSSSAFLFSLREQLQAHGMRGGGLYRVKNDSYGRLNFSTLDSMKLYKIMYNVPCNLFLERKRRVFEGFVKSRKLRA